MKTVLKKSQPATPYALAIDLLLESLRASRSGLSTIEVEKRLGEYGKNLIPIRPPATIFKIFFRQFLNPLIYILAVAAVVSLVLGHVTDTLFIGVVILVNAIIGTVQEYSAQKSAQSLLEMAASKCLVVRDGEVSEVDSGDLVPGDVVLLESGNKVPADLRLLTTHGLEIDESLLTGESLPVNKDQDVSLSPDVSLGDRINMAFTGSLVTKGRARGVVVFTGVLTELGKIADSIVSGVSAKPPLIIRMEKFTKNIAIFFTLVTLAMAAVLLLKGQTWHEVMMFSIALAVSAIPEGLPVALTVALSIASRKMAKRNVIVRELPAVEALGSCSYIATDKTGTLTVNQMTIQKIVLPDLPWIHVEGSGIDPKGEVLLPQKADSSKYKNLLREIADAGVLCNESQLAHSNGTWTGHGDAVDLAFLVMAHKLELRWKDIRNQNELISEIPFEAENQFAATLHIYDGVGKISIKGAVEKLLPMCDRMQSLDGEVTIDVNAILAQADSLAEAGFRVLGLAKKNHADEHQSIQSQLKGFCFLGLVGMLDPLRPEAAEAITLCRQAGIEVAMVTGDHPKTAFAIAKELGLADDLNKVVSGPQLKAAATDQQRAQLIEKGRVFARVEPHQKLEIVRHLLDQGQFVAVTGDGANDAPALKAANVGVAMGRSGTDIAKETADLIITDDRFASIVAGVEEGRIAYNNIRKVIYLLISTGVAEIFLFTLSLLFNMPLPLTAVQVLWLNLVTNGIQHIGLAFEPGEGNELKRAPRRTNEPIFDRLMLERIGLSAFVMGLGAFINFYILMEAGVSEDSARNLTLLLMVLFENVMVGNCRSETKSAFLLSPFKNRILLFGTIGAQLLHVAALYTPGIDSILGVSPVSLQEWVKLFVAALSVLFVMEIYKILRLKLMAKS